MSKQRLRVILEFNPNKDLDKKLWDKLSKLSNPAAHVKDILNGVMPPFYTDGYDIPISNIKFEEMDVEG